MAKQSDLTPTEIIDEFELNDITIELTAIVEKTSSVELANNGKKVLKMVVSNNKDRKIMITAWEREIEKLQKMKKTNDVLTFENLHCKPVPPYYTKYNLGNVNFTLNIRSNTIIKSHGQFQDEPKTEPGPTLCTLENLVKVSGQTRLHVYIQNTFEQLKTNFVVCKHGCITDGEYKLEVQTIDNGCIEDLIIDIGKGKKIEIIGKLYLNKGKVPIYKIQNLSSITILKEENMSLNLLFQQKKYIPVS